MRANLTRYAWWQFRDFARDRGVALIIIGVAIGATIIGPMRAMGEIDAVRAKQVLELIISQLSYITAFIALNGIISNDRKTGYYRFLFSKPVSIPAYYAQQFVVFLIGYLIVNLVLLGIFAIFAEPVSPVAPLVVCALVFLSFGGIAFLISSLFRYDWPILAAIFLGSSIFQSMWAMQEGWRRMLLSVLPPLHKVNGAMLDILRNGTMDGKTLLWLLGYSAICFAAGLVVLRRRPFA
jgi:hypothetical protein